MLRDHLADEPVFIVIYEGNPNEGETAVECCSPLHRAARHRVERPAAEMTTGEFARRSQLSLKALRLYERLGLLRPAGVDERNGYSSWRVAVTFPGDPRAAGRPRRTAPRLKRYDLGVRTDHPHR